MSTASHDSVRALYWQDGHGLYLLDQRLLPESEHYLLCPDATAVARAITDMVVRGAPAIGIAAAYGAALAAMAAHRDHGSGWRSAMGAAMAELRAARPTAVNLMWALDRQQRVADALPDDADPGAELLAEAHAIHEADVAGNRSMGRTGASLIRRGSGVLTHCNTGSLATGGLGTALGVIRTAWADARVTRVFADETRPWLQGARLTAWELARDGIPVELLADGAAAALMASGQVDWLIVGADRIAANGDVANKIGTYAAALAAREHGVGVMVAAPVATIDTATPSGGDIPIETRDSAEVLYARSCRTAPDLPGVGAWNPVFDVTPAELIDAIVTERGVAQPPDADSIARLAPDAG